MPKKYDEVLKAVQTVSSSAGEKIPAIFIKEFVAAVKDSKQDVRKIKKKAEELLKKLKTLNQREPDVKKAMALVSELTQTSGSSDGSQKPSQGSSDSPNATKGKKAASTEEHRSPSVSTSLQGVHGKRMTATPAARSIPNPKETIGDNGKILNQFVSELNLILSSEQDWLTDKTIEDSSAVKKKDLEDLHEHIKQLKERKSESLRKERDALSKKLVALREAILKESYATPKNEVTKQNDPDERVFTVIQTTLYDRHKNMLAIEKDLKNLKEKLSFDDKPSSTRVKDSEKLPLQRIQDHVTKLDELVNHRMQAVQQTNGPEIEAIDRQLRQLAGVKNKRNEQMPTLDSIQHTIQTLESLLKKPTQRVDKNMEENTSSLKSYVNEIKEIEEEVDKGVYADKDYKTFPKDAAKCLKSLRKKLKERQTRSEIMQEEFKALVDEMREKKYKDGSLKRLKGLEPQEYFTTLETIRIELKEKLALDQNLDQMVTSMEKLQTQPPKAKGRKNGSDQATPIITIKTHIAYLEDELKNIKQEICTLRKRALDDMENVESGDLREADWKQHLSEIEKNFIATQTRLQQMQTTHIEIAEVKSQLDAMEKRLIAPYQKQDPSRKHIPEARHYYPARESGVVRSLEVVVEKIEDILVFQNLKIQRHKDNKRENENKISEMLAEAEQLRVEKNDLLTRLSSIAGAKLVENNPNIADLSDPNRPTKLAEKYKETYDTEWTDAYEALEKEFKYEDKACCTALVKILMDVYDRCTEIAKIQASGIRGYLLNPPADPKELPQVLKGQDVQDSVRSKMISDLRKHTADISVKNIEKGFPNDGELFGNKTICKYRNRCIEICWFMSLQTPPVVLERPPTGKVKFDKTKYTEYTKKGTTIDFVTLPPMLIQENGALLCKGIAQGK